MDFSKYSDEELVQLYRAGNSQVTDFICDKYKPLVLSNATKFFLTGGETDDLIQEGMIGLFRAISSYDDSQSSFYHFANLCIRRQIFKAIESSNSKKHQLLTNSISLQDEESLLEGADILSNVQNPEHILIDNEHINNLYRSLMNVLSPMEQDVFKYYLNGFDYREIAEILGKEDKSVDNCIQRIRSKAKKL